MIKEGAFLFRDPLPLLSSTPLAFGHMPFGKLSFHWRSDA
jgi:hypothetical protein